MLFRTKQKVIPIFFASDNNYAPYLAVTLKSLLVNASKEYFYKIHILTSNMKEEIQNKIKKMETSYASIEFYNLSDKLEKIKEKFHLRDYYSIETYYRFFISDLFPEYDKVLYLDCDITILGDISDLYFTNISNYLVGAVQEQVMNHYDAFGNYVEQALNIKRKQYFNAGVLLINTAMFRACNIIKTFFNLIDRFTFRITQDEDYLNVICKDKVRYLDLGWNKMPFEEIGFDNVDLQLIHYNLGWKPWHYENVLYEEYFWEYAYQTEFYDFIKNELKTYSNERKEKDKLSFQLLQQLAIEDSKDFFNYRRSIKRDLQHNYLQRSINNITKIPVFKNISRIITIKKQFITYSFIKYIKKIVSIFINI